jgi:SHS family lactate transporter-like MFS transporter
MMRGSFGVMGFSVAGLHFVLAGASSPVPAHLNELSPPRLRGLIPGIAYNVGQLFSAPVSQILLLVAESFPTSFRRIFVIVDLPIRKWS